MEGGPRNIGMCVELAVTCWKSRKYCGGHGIIVYSMKSTKSGDRNMDDSSSPPYFNYDYPQSSAHVDTITNTSPNESEYFCHISISCLLVPNPSVSLGMKSKNKKNSIINILYPF